MAKSIIFGKGYVGESLRKQLPNFLTTYRSGDGDIYFDLDNQSTWNDLPPIKTAILTFPIFNLVLVQDFFDKYLSQCEQVFLYGTTSIYSAKIGLLDEESPLDYQHKRYEVECYLLNQGVNILTLSGICGPCRQPKDWLIKNRIANGSKMVNLIHCDDIVNLTTKLLQTNLQGQRINLTAGAYRWKDIAKQLDLSINFRELIRQDRIISNQKLLNLLATDYQFICPYKS